jgi:hypothetical protein
VERRCRVSLALAEAIAANGWPFGWGARPMTGSRQIGSPQNVARDVSAPTALHARRKLRTTADSFPGNGLDEAARND